MRVNFAKMKLIRLWQKRKKEIDLQLMKNNVTSDEQFHPIAKRFFQEIGPLWYKSFRIDHPHDEYNHWNLKCWIEKNEYLCRQHGKPKDAQAWIQMYNYFVTLLELKLIPRDPYEPINIAHSQ